jgi:hypothetical protein
MAMALAPATSPARARGVTAARAKSRVWMAVPSGATWIQGWIVGTAWLTLPMSEEASRSPQGGPTRG